MIFDRIFVDLYFVARYIFTIYFLILISLPLFRAV